MSRKFSHGNLATKDAVNAFTVSKQWQAQANGVEVKTTPQQHEKRGCEHDGKQSRYLLFSAGEYLLCI